MKSFKFYIPKEFPHPTTAKVIGRDWDFSIDSQALEFSILFREHILSGLDIGEKRYKKIKATIDDFELLKNFSAHSPLHQTTRRDNCIRAYDNTVAYMDRGKKKTVVALSGGSWYKTLHDNAGLDHTTHWAFDDLDKNEFNVISFREQVERSYKNPVVYDSHYYNGFHDAVPNLKSMAEYIESLFPGSEYYVIGDCKLGHSAALLSHFLSARKCFLHSAVTTVVEDDLKDILLKNDSGDYYVDLYQYVSFEVLLRALYFADQIPEDLNTVQKIITQMPQCEFCFLYHSEDPEFLIHANLINTAVNVKKYITSDTTYSLHNHVLLNYLRKFNIVNSFFMDDTIDIQ
jgi:hypothetical protein